VNRNFVIVRVNTGFHACSLTPAVLRGSQRGDTATSLSWRINLIVRDPNVHSKELRQRVALDPL
jgi:hypothetical protein